MDLQAAKHDPTRAWTLARATMVICFATASLMLIASLNMDRSTQSWVDVSPPAAHSQ